MKRSINTWQFAGFVFTGLVGSLLHFLYEWTNQSVIAAPFSAVNESTWEHMKLLFFPMFVFALIQSAFFKKRESFWCIKLIGTVVGLALIPALFYTYNGAIGPSPDWINIAIFFVAAAIGYLAETLLFKSGKLNCRFEWLCFILLCVLGVLFIVFTFITPQIPLFVDPLTMMYGINA